MERGDARKLIDESILGMRNALWLTDWKITVEYRDLPGDQAGECDANTRYRHAKIAIDGDGLSRDQVLEVLRHELLHIHHARFNAFYEQVRELVSKEDMRALNVTWRDGIEETVGQIERVLDYNGLSPAALVRRGKKALGMPKRKAKR